MLKAIENNKLKYQKKSIQDYNNLWRFSTLTTIKVWVLLDEKSFPFRI